jgi:hypothetical protein
VLREVRKDLPRFCGRKIALSVNPRVAEMLLGPVRQATGRLGEELGREVEVRARPGLHQEQFEVTALDTGAPISLSLRWLEERGADEPETLTPLPESPTPEIPEEAAGEKSAAPSATAESSEAVGEAAPAEPAPAEPPDLAAGPETGPGASNQEPEGGAPAGTWGRPNDAAPAEQKEELPAWSRTESDAVGTRSDDVEALAASPLDANVESPIILPSDPPEES